MSFRTDTPLISLVINADTRNGYQHAETTAEQMFEGCKSLDFLIDGVKNKRKFFDGYDTELILFVDQHLEIPNHKLDIIRDLVDTLVIRKHTNENSFNDYNYLAALQLARGEYVAHFDQDTAAYTSSPRFIQYMIEFLDHYKFVSYPSHWCPRAITDPSFGERTWASTRFFMCKRETLKFDVLRKCIEEPEWAYQTFGDSPRRCNWLEHFLTLTNENSCFYPPMQTENYSIFCWNNYKSGTLKQLNEYSYDKVVEFINQRGGVAYPCDITA